MSVQGGSYADGAQIIQETCTGAAIQQWTWNAVNGGYTLVNKQTNKCLDDYGFSKNDGAKLNQWTCLANDAQIWRPTETDKGLKMTVKASNKRLDVLSVSLATGATVTQWVCNGQGNQAWRARHGWRIRFHIGGPRKGPSILPSRCHGQSEMKHLAKPGTC